MPEVGWPDFAAAAQRTESTRSCCPSSRQSSTSFMCGLPRAVGVRIRCNVAPMRVAVAFDHRGVRLRETLLEELAALGHETVDLGTDTDEVRIDYPDKARELGEAILNGDAERGILVCGSGVGASVAACKLPGIRAAICHDAYSAHQGVEHDDMNVLCLGSEVVGPSLARDLIA